MNMMCKDDVDLEKLCKGERNTMEAPKKSGGFSWNMV